MAAHTIWQLDDAEHWHEITRATLAQMDSSWQSHHFHSGQSMLMALDSCSAADLPAIILMDFYLPNERGDHITAAIRGLELSVESHIVGFSSVRSGSEAIVAAGGNSIVRKYDGHGVNPDLQRWLEAFPVSED